MNITRYLLLPGSVLLSVALVGLLLLGCESTTTDTGITVAPSTATISGPSTGVVFTASCSGTGTNGINKDLYLPLEWSVSNPSLGNIMSSVGFTAIYESTGAKGRNAITVRDQGGAEGVALVNQI